MTQMSPCLVPPPNGGCSSIGRRYFERMGVMRVTLAVLAAAALAATLALLAVAAPAASKQHAATGAYCPDKTARQHDATVANNALKKANANVKLKTKAVTHAKKTHKSKK